MPSLYKTNIKNLKGVGFKTAEFFKKLGVNSVGQLINFYPRKYEDWSSPSLISESCVHKIKCIKITVISDFEIKNTKSGKSLYITTGFDGISTINIVFFNNKFAPNLLKKNQEYLLFGNISKNAMGYEIISPKIKKSNENQQCISPIYPQIQGINSTKISTCVKEALSLIPKNIPDTLPKSIKDNYNLCNLSFALKNIHFPVDSDSLKTAQKRLIFEEFFFHLLSIYILKSKAQQKTEIKIKNNFLEEFAKKLPFALTNSQKKVISECAKDMKNENCAMNRLLQGDVGSGKTAVAAALTYNTVKNGYQVAIMAPTEILVTQHLSTFKKIFKDTKINIEALYSSLKTKKQKLIKDAISAGEVDIVIGTHSLISESVEFKNLGFIVTDEQHRFGVNQRKNLVNKAINPHVLVMSATPIPRTLAMVFYGDLGISILDEALPGRQKIDTFYINSEKRERALSFLKQHVKQDFQGYVVCASVKENEELAIKDVENCVKELIRFGFSENIVTHIHGKMSGNEKQEIMERFNRGNAKILVATTVIEVGVDNPNATVMIIENAERFGISQLHQLRGRVGRGKEKSYCILISDSQTKESNRRFEAMKNTNDGFILAEEDLKLRGPGDFFGVNQHGIPKIKTPTTHEDLKLIKLAGEAAQRILEEDPNLENEELKFIKARAKKILEIENLIF